MRRELGGGGDRLWMDGIDDAFIDGGDGQSCRICTAGLEFIRHNIPRLFMKKDQRTPLS